jgi:2-polyprenyl-3-methyl-5-hydroxy-6-metoxy-1,4-benzoquinol methylase
VPGRAAFRERTRCISCDGEALETVWQGRFCDEPVRSWLRDYKYNGNVEAALGEQNFLRVRCQDCGTSFHRRVLTDAWLGILYGEWISPAQVDAFEADRHSSQPDAPFVSAVQLIKHLLRLRHLARDMGNRSLRLLDFGCGDGKFLSLGSALGFEAFGVDASASRRDRAERSGIPIAQTLEALDGQAAGGYDCITLFEVLEHLAEPREILRALAARMRPGGVLLVEVPDCSGIGEPRSFDQFSAVQPLEHVNHFTPGALAALCRREGFIRAPRVPAHVTTDPLALLRTEASRFVHRSTTSQYFRRP